MKKSTILLALILSFGLVGCGNTDKGSTTTTQSNPSDTNSSSTTTAKDDNIIKAEKSIEKLSSLVDEKKYDEAKALIQDLSKQKLDDSQRESVNKLKNRIDTELSKATTDKNQTTSTSKKQQYKEKLDNLELSLKPTETKLQNGATTKDMREAAGDIYKAWDNALNEIYGVLKEQLSASDMKNLQTEEVQWISKRDAKAKEASSSVKGGTLEPVIYTDSLGRTTKDRCYELVEKYMK
jgi:uncharacterized protein YecT (DUF1311 family)